MRALAAPHCSAAAVSEQGARRSAASCSRRSLLAGGAAGAALLLSPRADAVQGLVPGRIPGLSKEVDAEGFRTYSRPEGKSGGHGVGWSVIPPYTFRVAAGWDEVDLRYSSAEEGDISVVVAPVNRFRDIGFNADVRIAELVSPDQLIAGFAPELIGVPLTEGDVLTTETKRFGGLDYYRYELKTSKVPHLFVSATAYKNRLYIMSTSANGRQWRRGAENLRTMTDSFRVKESA